MIAIAASKKNIRKFDIFRWCVVIWMDLVLSVTAILPNKQ